MAVRRMNGFGPMTQLRDEMDRLVGDLFTPGAASLPARLGMTARAFPALNVWEDGDHLFVEAEVPGLKSENVEISVVGRDVTISGRRGGEPSPGAVYHRQERGFGEFNRVLRAPFDVDAERVEATLANGVLLIKLPKAESAKPKKIQVKTA